MEKFREFHVAFNGPEDESHDEEGGGGGNRPREDTPVDAEGEHNRM